MNRPADENISRLGEEAVTHRLKFNRLLEPIKVMLVHRKMQLNPEEWFEFVAATKHSIIQNPDQYLGSEYADVSGLDTTIETIFAEFLHQTADR